MTTSDSQLDVKTIDVAPPDSVVIDSDGNLLVTGDSDKQAAADPDLVSTDDLVG
jgi:hypothetical protein